MKKFKNFATRHPYLFMLVIFPLIPYILMLLQLGFARLFGFTSLGADSFQDSTKFLSILLYLTILWQFGWLRSAGFQTLGRWQAWLIVLIASVFEVALAIRSINGHFEWLNLIILASPSTYLLVGLFEEIAFRGLILYAFLHLWGDTYRGVLKSVFISSLLFGIGHLATIFTGNTVLGALCQTASSTISGVLYAALVLYGWSIWPVVIGHFLTDAIGYGNLTNIQDVTQANLSVFWIDIPLLFLAFFLIIRARMQWTNKKVEGDIS